MTTATTKGNFDFTAVNEATKNLPAGMKLAIAQGLMSNVISTFKKFENELEDEAISVAESLQTLRDNYKANKPQQS